jgi:1-acyl-sn-glycerol-3-phosphate acyltransferase
MGIDQRAQGLVGDPSPRPSRGYRLTLAIAGTIGKGLFGFRTQVTGRANLPRRPDGSVAGGWVAAGLPHRTWVDPFVVAVSLPREPRLIFFGDGPAIFRSAWRRGLVRRVGGVIPIWPGGDRVAVETYFEAAAAALDAGAVLCLFPETGPAATPGTARPFGSGLAYFAIRTDAPIVPVILGGTHELYRGRRFQMDILPPTTWRDLADLPPEAERPAPWSSAERRTAHRVTLALHERTAAAVETAHLAVEPDPTTRRHWRWLTTAWH